jgi:hypothetical protein
MITLEQAANEFFEVAKDAAEKAEGDDFFYVNPNVGDEDYKPNRCLYVHDRTPGCIVGTWLHNKHNVSLEVLRGREGLHAGALISVLRESGFKIDSQARQFTCDVQYEQDHHQLGWVEAVRKVADRYGLTSKEVFVSN